MIDRDPNQILFFLAGIVIFSYIVERLTKKIKFPSVIVLIFTGVGIHYLLDIFGLGKYDLSDALPLLGTLGLIVIVFEGALEIRFDDKGKKNIGFAGISSLVILLISTFITAYFLEFITHADINTCLLNAVPLSVVSSSIAISAVKVMPQKFREFIVYESTFSDIFGIMLFNFLLSNQTLEGSAFGYLGLEMVLISLASLLFTIFILYLLKHIYNHTKFFFIVSVLIFAYAFAKSFHLSALLIVLVLGISLNNIDLFPSKRVRHYFIYPRIRQDMQEFHSFSAELAFLIRTFFFIVFGYTIEISTLSNADVLIYGSIILSFAILVRAFVLILIPHRKLNPELFLLPRGLISILLFISIPTGQQLGLLQNGVLLFTILASGIFMAIGMMLYTNKELPQ